MILICIRRFARCATEYQNTWNLKFDKRKLLNSRIGKKVADFLLSYFC